MKFNVFLRMKNAKAEGIYDTDKKSITVKAGAIFEREIADSFKTHNYLKQRQKIIKKNLLEDFVLKEDYEFNSPSAAAAVIGGRPAAGPLIWKTKNGHNLNDLNLKIDNEQIFSEFLKNNINHQSDDDYKKETEYFVNVFPMTKLRTMTLEDYDKIGSKKSFCYLLEYKTKSLSGGSFGSSRNKLFFNKDDEYFTAKYIKDKYPSTDILELFNLYKNDLYKFVSEFDKDTYIATDYDILPKGANYIKSKLLNLYYPDTYIYIDSNTILSKIANYFYIELGKDSESIEINISLINHLNEIYPEVNNLNMKNLSDIIWRFYKEFIDVEEQEEIDEIVLETSNDELFMSDDKVKEIVSLLKRKKNIILQGTPGVGKTFSIKKIIKRNFIINNNDEQIKTIQFHQSFSYEEFIEGLRPTSYDQGFSIESGIFKEFIDNKVSKNTDQDYFLIIDEINRGNISKIFGELLMLIEKDKREIESVILPYSKEEFTVPKNLYIIGTMNTADRSLALMDYALRRRFSFVELVPMYDTEKFNDYLSTKNLTVDNIKQINGTMTTINSEISRDLGNNFAIGHSYFVDNQQIEDFDSWYENIIKFDIIPILKEYYFDEPEKIESFLNELGINSEYSD